MGFEGVFMWFVEFKGCAEGHDNGFRKSLTVILAVMSRFFEFLWLNSYATQKMGVSNI